MRTRVEAHGPADAGVMWSAYVDTSQWARWAPHIRRVEPEGTLVEGMRGVVYGPARSSAKFVVTFVDQRTRRWGWRVRSGAVRLTIDHEVTDGTATVTIDGPALFVSAYAPIARRALERLVRSPAA